MKVVKICDRIGFCPESDPPSIECLLAYLEERLIVISDLHLAPMLDDSEGMPAGCSDRTVVVLD